MIGDGLINGKSNIETSVGSTIIEMSMQSYPRSGMINESVVCSVYLDKGRCLFLVYQSMTQ